MKRTRSFKTVFPAVAVILAMLLCLLPAGAVYAQELPESSNTFTFTDTGISASDESGSGFDERTENFEVWTRNDVGDERDAGIG